MKASEVRKLCKEMRENPVLLLDLEFQYREQIYNKYKKTAS